MRGKLDLFAGVKQKQINLSHSCPLKRTVAALAMLDCSSTDSIATPQPLIILLTLPHLKCALTTSSRPGGGLRSKASTAQRSVDRRTSELYLRQQHAAPLLCHMVMQDSCIVGMAICSAGAAS